MNHRSLIKLEFPKIKEEIKRKSVCGAGKDLIDKLEPMDSIESINIALEETKEAIKLLQIKSSAPFQGVYDVLDAIEKGGKGGVLNPGQLLHVANILKSSANFIKYLRCEDFEPVRLKDIASGITPLGYVQEAITFAIVSETEVSDRASTKLLQIRRSLKDKQSSVKDKVQSLVRSNSQYLQDNLYTVRGDRYVIPVKAEHKGSVPGLVHDTSSSGQTLFIEPLSLVNLNNEIKELMIKEREEIERILRELSKHIHNHYEEIKRNAQIIYEFDVIFAKAKYSLNFDLSVPEVKNNGTFELLSARHPLIDEKKVVPSTIYLGENYTSLIVTGPNTGGKTVTLKTVGLLHVMALSGIPIPVNEGSHVSFFKEIYADIGDEQSIEQSLSTFSGHMTNIVSIMEKADEDSLVLFDELGAGTDPTEGAALAMAILEELRVRACKVVATTHYSELKAYAVKTDGVENASVEFDVNTLKPTYRLLIGVPGKSNAFLISKRLGLSEHIIDKSKSLIQEDSLKFEDLIENLQKDKIEAKNDALKSQAIRRDLELKQKDLDEKLRRVEEIRQRQLEEAKREARNMLRNVKEEADEILKSIRNLNSTDSGLRNELEKHRQRLRDTLEIIDSDDSKNNDISDNKSNKKIKVKIGEEYIHNGINQNVSVLTLPDDKGNLMVQAGIMKITANVNDLSKNKVTKEEKKFKKRQVNLNLKSVPSSIDLRGLDAQEAIYRVDQYLDEVALSGLNEVTIIHGVGTGVLKQEVNKVLGKHPHVKKRRPGEYGEGGMGVTIVEVK